MVNEIQERVKKIIIDQLGVKPEQVVPKADFVDDLGADSLDTVELVMALEEEFSFEMPDEDAERIKTVGDVIEYLRKLSAKCDEIQHKLRQNNYPKA